MTRLLIVSDSHGCPDHILAAVEAERPDYLLHLGDGERDLEPVRARYPELKILHVRGNCDRPSQSPALRVFSVEGQTVFLCHGHEYNVKLDRDLLRLRYSALERDARLVCFGHTHCAYQDRSLGMLVLNPGTIGYYNPSYALVTVDGARIDAEIVRLSS